MQSTTAAGLKWRCRCCWDNRYLRHNSTKPRVLEETVLTLEPSKVATLHLHVHESAPILPRIRLVSTFSHPWDCSTLCSSRIPSKLTEFAGTLL
jgi:hypothetical protein